MIKHRWGAIDDEQRQGIRNYVSNLIIKISSDEASFRAQKVFLNKLNIILVEARPPCTFMPILARSQKVFLNKLTSSWSRHAPFCPCLSWRGRRRSFEQAQHHPGRGMRPFAHAYLGASTRLCCAPVAGRPHRG